MKGLEAALHDHRNSVAGPCAAELPAAGMPLRFPFNFTLPWAPSRRFMIIAASCVGVIVIGMSLLWWRLMSGPISLDVATPWLTAAIEENFGGRRHIEVGRTQLERDENGRTALRVRDIVVRDADGTVVASAPGAEVGFSGKSLLAGRVRAERLSLVGAQVAVRIEQNGQLTVFAGADKRPFATAAATTGSVPAVAAPAVTSAAPQGAQRSGVDSLLAALAWIDGLSAAGLDGYELDEIGIKNGNVAIDDQRNGKQWAFNKINLSLTRSRAGELSLSLGSDDTEHPWQLLASVKPVDNGHRLINVEGRKVPLGDILVATRVLEGPFEVDVPVSATFRAQVGPDGVPERATGRVLIDAGTIGRAGTALGRVAVDRAEFSLDWDAQRRVVAVPFQILAAGNRFTLFMQAEAPREQGAPWTLGLSGGTIVLGPLSATEGEPLVANRVVVRGRFDPAKRRLDIDQGDIAAKELGVAFSGSLDYSTSDPHLGLGLAANNMTATQLKQSWPPFVNPKLRAWMLDHLLGGNVASLDIYVGSPLSHVMPGGPPIPDDGLSVKVQTRNATIRPVDELPPISAGDFAASIIGRVAKVELPRGTVELPSGRKLTMTGGLFEMTDIHAEPKMSKTRFRVEGPMPAAAELLAFERLRDASDIPLDPATARGTVTAQVLVGMPVTGEIAKGSVSYQIGADLANFAVDKFVMGQKIEGSALKVTATQEGYLLKGDVRIGGTPASIEFRKTAGEGEPEVRLQTTLDDAARSRLGFDLYGTVKGPLGVRLAGRVANGDGESRYAVDADLTQAKVDNLLPGWTKAAGRPARAAFNMTSKGKAARFDDLLVEGSGVLVRGTIETDSNGELVGASFPVFALSDGDKASLKAERANDTTLKVTMRGDVFDGRQFVKAQMAGPTSEQRARQTIPDLDVDIKLGAIAGFNGEALRNMDVRMSRRAGEIRSLSVNGRLGVDTPLIGDLRGRGSGRQVIYLETNDAGALFRFTDTYPRIYGGKMWVAMDPPSATQAPQDGQLNIERFAVRGEPALERVASSGNNGPNGTKSGVDFSRMYVEFTRQPGKLSLREGVVRGPVIGATIEGTIDYTRDDVRMRGTFVPLYGLNNMFGQIPIVGLFMGGEKEGLVGITYEVVGPPNAPTLRVNPISAITPGILRKVFEFPSASERSFNNNNVNEQPTIR